MDLSQVQVTEGNTTTDISKDSFFCFAVLTLIWLCYQCRMNRADLAFKHLLCVNEQKFSEAASVNLTADKWL